jgi:hypothetical protein
MNINFVETYLIHDTDKMASYDSEMVAKIIQWLHLIAQQCACHDPISMTKPIFETEMQLDALSASGEPGSLNEGNPFYRIKVFIPPLQRPQAQCALPKEYIPLNRPPLTAVWIGNHPTPIIMEQNFDDSKPLVPIYSRPRSCSM